MDPLQPVYTAPLFKPLHEELIALLQSLQPADWARPTAAGTWRVRDVVAHLVDVDLRKLSTSRDAYVLAPDPPVAGFEAVVKFLNGLNAEWVRVARRFSPRVLIELMAVSGPAVAELMANLPAHHQSVFPVEWAGERKSENWMDVGREYTERWHHQMQIRDAVGAPALIARQWLHPVLDLSARALPRAYAVAAAPEGTSIVLRITDDAGGSWSWSLLRGGSAWTVMRGEAPDPAVTVSLDPDAAWRLFFNVPGPARERASIDGDTRLAEPLFTARAVMV
jgi:uncharacterized protein (TIGR03083 family)